MKFDYVFIGAGPGNLTAANFLLEQGVSNILILESGNSLNKRICPGQRRHTCTHCHDNLCPAIEGEGGSSAIYGNKFCYFPASNRILEFFSKQIVTESNAYLDKLLSPYFESRFNRHEVAFDTRKNYTSDIIPRFQFQELIRKLLLKPKATNILRLNTAVVDVKKLPDFGFILTTGNGDNIETDQLVLGCGRSSHALLRRIFMSLGISFEENSPDIGFRLEAPNDAFSDDYRYQADPKYRFTHSPYGSSRTFCACTGGLVVPVKFGNAFFADGAFGDKSTGLNNLAFMVRSNKPIPSRDLEKWCFSINVAAGNKLLLGEISLNDTGEQQLVAKILALITHWPTEDHRFMISELLRLTLSEKYKLLKCFRTSSAKVKVYGPAIDLYWPKPKLSEGLKTDLPGLFMIGDATGVSRGLVQAMVAGSAWAITQQTDSIYHKKHTRSNNVKGDPFSIVNNHEEYVRAGCS